MKVARSTKKTPELNERQLRFVQEYLKDMNAKAAYIRAGYEAKNADPACYALLGDVRVQQLLAQAFAKHAEKAEVTVEKILNELDRLAFADVSEAFNSNGGLKDIHDFPLSLRKSVSSFEVEELYEWAETTRGRKVKENIGRLKKVKFWPKERCLEMLGKYRAMFVDRRELSGPGGIPLVPPPMQNVFVSAPEKAPTDG